MQAQGVSLAHSSFDGPSWWYRADAMRRHALLITGFPAEPLCNIFPQNLNRALSGTPSYSRLLAGLGGSSGESGAACGASDGAEIG